ncbi:MAG: cellulase family glycosylhydrolase [Prevotella sp.]
MIKKAFSSVVAFVAMLTCMACSDTETISDGGVNVPDGLNISENLLADGLTVSKTGGETTISVQSKKDVQASSDQAWCTVEVGSKSQTMQVTPVKVSVAANTETDDRAANITISAGGDSKTVKVSQKAFEGLILKTTSVELSADGGAFTVELQANGKYSVEINDGWISSANTKSMTSYTERFIADANPASERTGSITFTRESLVEKVTVKQAAKQIAAITRNAMDIAPEMYPGWNLGNTMEATGEGLACETSWQPTKTTKEIIDYVKSQGFKSVRIPCSWYIHTNNGKIDEAWIARVKEIVDYCIADGLYVLLNDHWDSGWIEVDGFTANRSKYEAVSEETIASKTETLKDLWTQIATYFKDYDEHLLFAGLNEPFQQYDLFNNRHKELTPILLRYNQAFVDAVRATGGNNANRILVVQGPSTSISSTCESYFTMPTDTPSKALMVEVHYYEPWDFCGQEDNATWFWGSANHVSGSSHNATWGEESYTKSQCEKMRKKFYDNGVPVIVGECGANWRKLSENQAEHDASVKAWFKCLVENSGNNGMIPMIWDINSTNQNGEKGTLTIINRTSLSIFCQPALDGIKEGVAASQWK